VVTIALTCAVLLAGACSGGIGRDADAKSTTPDPFLDRLTGSWRLTGTMGSVELRQRVDAEWVLGGQFLRMHVVEEGAPTPGQSAYEAVYMLGRDPDTGEYVMHLFDMFGAGYARTIGVGTLRGDSVDFRFDYPDGAFSNTFIWQPDTGGWRMVLRQRAGDGWKLFATKTLARE
jgi:hypothetical protein